MLNHWAAKLGKDVRAYSAGSAPSGRLNPFALEALTTAGVDVSGYRSKSWDEFVGVRRRCVVIMCDSAAETCPYWPGSPVSALGLRRSVERVGGDEGKRLAFELTRQAIGYRMLQPLALPLDRMSNAELQTALTEISQN
jgi:arsenate reductase